MSLDFASNFARANAANKTEGRAKPFGGLSRQDQNEERTKAQYWLNIGYPVIMPSEHEGEDDRETFVSLNAGIPLDNIEAFDLGKQRTGNMAMLRQAQNALLENFKQAASELAPGEARIIMFDDSIGLGIEIRRVRGEQETPVEAENPMLRSFAFRPKA